MMSDGRAERRKSQRVEANLKLKVQVPLSDGSLRPAMMETLNISSSGVYFRSDHFMEPMTKLDMILDLPLPAEGEGEMRVAAAQCEGIVVRVVPEDPDAPVDHFEIAVFFTQIDDRGREYLKQHIAMLLTSA